MARQPFRELIHRHGEPAMGGGVFYAQRLAGDQPKFSAAWCDPRAPRLQGRTAMKKSMLAGAAMLAAAAVAVPVLAWSQSPPPPAAPAGGAGPGAPGASGGPEHHGWMQHRGWERWAHRSPREGCVDRLAKRAGFIASTGFKLNLTADQKPLWDKVVAANQATADSERKLCDALPATAEDRGKETMIDRLNHRQQMLQAQLQGLQQSQPAVQALYDKLTADQKAILDHPFHRG
jgi:hypothetical protein